MISINTLPNIYDKKANKEEKLKKKKKKKKYHVHIETENASFLKMYKIMQSLGIEDCDFFLALYDTRLIDIDPFDEDLTFEQQTWVFEEVKSNYWYFIRECVRIQDSGSDLGNGGGTRYKLHRGNLALGWCLLNSINFFLELPRQNFKTYSIMVAMTWLYNFGTTNSQMMLIHKDHKGSKANLATIKSIRNALPYYLRFDHKVNDEGKLIKIPENVESITNPKTHNSISTFASATSKEKADLLGRGATQAIQNMDEFGFLRFNMVIYEAASPAATQAAESAEANGKIHCKMLSTTPGDMNTEYGRDAFDFKDKCMTFSEDWYKMDPDSVKALINTNSENLFTSIKFSYKQLGRSTEYFDKVCHDLGGNKLKIRREILLEWLIINEDPVFDEEALADLVREAESRKIYKTYYIDDVYQLDLYKPIPKNYPVIISCDVAGGDARDNSAITIIDTRTKEVIGEFENNRIDTVAFSYVIHTIATKIAPNCLIVIERNNVGVTVITNLLKTNVKSKLYYEKRENDTQDKYVNGRLQDGSATDVHNYGLWTSDDKKVQMQETLVKYVNHYGHRLATKKLAVELNGLVYNKKRVIDHTAKGHDDLVMAYNIGMWVYWHGKNLQRWGIFPVPDVDPMSGLTEDEVIEREERKQIEREEKLNDAYNYIHNDHKGQAKFPTVKTINDFYNEMDQSTINEMNEIATGKSNINNLYRKNNISNRNKNIFDSGSRSDDFASSLINDVLGKDF